MEVDDAIALQKGHVNDCLPQSYAGLVGDEAISLLKQIKADLSAAASSLDLHSAKGLFHRLNL